MAKLTLTRRGVCDVAVIGSGPAGLAAATTLKERGVPRVIVLERETKPGGIPRHCGHPPFGMREFQRILTGPIYARRLVERALAADVILRTDTTVISIHPGGRLLLSDSHGAYQLQAKRVIIATGVRELSPAARLISGARPLGMVSTGALQALIYLHNRVPFRRPVIVGTELVAFSALLTCLRAGIRPLAMVEPAAQITARQFCRWYPRLHGIPLHLNTRLSAISGTERVQAVQLEHPERGSHSLQCDGVVFTGCFLPEVALLRGSHLTLDMASGGPNVDQYGRCSDSAYFAVGNLLRPIETAGWCWREANKVGSWVADDLNGRLPQTHQILSISSSDPIKFVLPQRVALPFHGGMRHLQLRFNRPAYGRLVAYGENRELWARKMSVLPERRVLIPLAGLLTEPFPSSMIKVALIP